MKFPFTRIPTLFFLFLFGNLFGLFTIVSAQGANQDSTVYIISTGSKGTPYYSTAKELISLLQDSLNRSQLFITTSSGSLENLRRIREGEADFAIVQKDAFVQAHYDENDPLVNAEVIMPLFPEILQIVVRGEKGIIPFSSFRQKIISGEIPKLAIGMPNSMTNLTTRKVFNLFGLDLPDSVLLERNPTEYLEEFISGKINAFAFMSGPPLIQLQGSIQDSIGIVSFSKPDQQRILSHLQQLEAVEIGHSTYNFIPEGDTVNAIGTWAFWIGQTDMYDQMCGDEKKSILDLLLSHSNFPAFSPRLSSTFGEQQYFKIAGQPGEMRITHQHLDHSSFFQGLPMASDLNTALNLGIGFRWPFLFAILLGLVISGLLIFTVSKSFESVQWFRIKHIVLLGLFLVGSYILMAELILLLEWSYCKEYSIHSPVLDLPRTKFYTWLLQVILAGFDSNIYPISLGGQLLVAGSLYLGVATFGVGIVYEIIFNYNLNRRRKGMKSINHKDHYVICGWNDHTPDLIKRTIDALHRANPDGKNHVVVINTLLGDSLEKDSDLDKQLTIGNLEYINGEPRELNNMTRANITKAKTVILVADEESDKADERTLLRAHAISRFCQKESNIMIDKIYIIAEVNDIDFKESLLDAGVNEVICTTEVGNKIIVQSTLNHGVSAVLEEVLTYDDDNEFYLIDLENHPTLVEKNFDELLAKLRAQNVLLIGIKFTRKDESGDEIIDLDILLKLDSSLNLKSHLIVNPTSEAEKFYKTHEHDQLIVLAENWETLKRLK